MNNIVNQIICDNTIKSYLVVLLIIILTLIIRKRLSRFFAGLLYTTFGDATKKIQKQAFVNLVVQPLELFVFLFVFFVSLDKLTFPEILEFNIFKFSFKQIIDSFSNTLLIISFIWLCIRMIDFIAIVLREKANISKDVSESQIIVFFKDFLKVIVVIIGLLLVLHFSFNRNIGNLFTGLSLVGAAIALATRESLENLIASFIIFFDKPFQVGDVVKVNQFTGTIEKIGLRSTRIRTEYKTYITVPNKQMVDTVVDNFSLRTQRKGEYVFELDLKTTADEIINLIAQIKNIFSNISEVEDFNVHLSDIGKLSHNITYNFFIASDTTLVEFNSIKEKINIAIVKKVEEMGLKFSEKSIQMV